MNDSVRFNVSDIFENDTIQMDSYQGQVIDDLPYSINPMSAQGADGGQRGLLLRLHPAILCAK